MAITACIDGPLDEVEEDFDVPVCTLAAYHYFILPRAIRLHLDLIVNWRGLGEVTQADAPEFFRQVQVFLESIERDPGGPAFMDMSGRFGRLVAEMKAALERRPDVVFLIC